MRNIIREFNTKNFRVVVEALPEDDLDLSFDEDGEIKAKIDKGELEAFCVRAVASFKGAELAEDFLGGCIDETPRAFMDHIGIKNYVPPGGQAGQCGSYFADMVATVCKDARAELLKMQAVKVRTCK
jgi:hypothetical protein